MISLKVFKTLLLRERFPHVSFSSPIDVGSHNQPEGIHTFINNVSFSSPTDVGSHNPPPSGSNLLTSTPPRVYPLQGLASTLAHHLVSTLLQGSTSSLAHHLVSTPLGLSLLAGTPPRVHPLQGSASSLAHRLVPPPSA